MYRVNKKIPMQSKTQFLNTSYELLYQVSQEFPFLMLDTREVMALENERCNVAYKAFPHGEDWIRFPDKMSIGEFLQYVQNLMKKYGTTVEIVRDEMDTRSNDQSKRFKFYGDNIRVSVHPSGVFNHVVNLEIRAPDEYEERIQSMIDKLQHSNGSDESQKTKENDDSSFPNSPEELKQEFRDRKYSKI